MQLEIFCSNFVTTEMKISLIKSGHQRWETKSAVRSTTSEQYDD